MVLGSTGGRGAARELEGIVIHLSNYGEADRIVELLTRDEGRVALMARGARASRRRFAGALDLFVGLRAQVIPRGNLWTLSGADVIAPRAGIRRGLEYIQRASVLCEVARVLAAEHQEALALYEALGGGLDALNVGDLAQAAVAFPRMLQAAGILPDLGARAGAGATTLVSEVLLTGRCQDVAAARRVEAWVIRLVEDHIGRPLRSRLAGLVL